MQAAVPLYDAVPMRNMADISMTMMPGQVAASKPDRTRIGGIMPMMMGVSPAQKKRRTGYQEKLDLPQVTNGMSLPPEKIVFTRSATNYKTADADLRQIYAEISCVAPGPGG